MVKKILHHLAWTVFLINVKAFPSSELSFKQLWDDGRVGDGRDAVNDVQLNPVGIQVVARCVQNLGGVDLHLQRVAWIACGRFDIKKHQSKIRILLGQLIDRIAPLEQRDLAATGNRPPIRIEVDQNFLASTGCLGDVRFKGIASVL